MKIGFISINRNYFTSFFFQNFAYFQYHRYHFLIDFSSPLILLMRRSQAVVPCSCALSMIAESFGVTKAAVSPSVKPMIATSPGMRSLFLDSIEGGISDNIVKGEDGIRSVLLFEETEGSVSGHIEIDSVADTRSRSIEMRFSLSASR